MQQVISSRSLQSHEQRAYGIEARETLNVAERFLTWCNTQEKNRFFWLAIALFGNIGMVLPFTLLAVLFASGNNFILWILACVVNVPVLAVNLAAQPTRFTLPTLFFAWFINALIIVYSLAVLLLG